MYKQISHDAEYDGLIKKIRIKKVITIVSAVIAVLAVFLFCTPSHIEFMGKVYVDYKGMNPFVIVLLIILIYFAECFALVFILAPLTTSLNQECDPQKYLVLNFALGKSKQRNSVGAQAYFYMGDFASALAYAERLISSGKPALVSSGLFYKARCEFFAGDTEALKLTAKQLEDHISKIPKKSEKIRNMYNELQKHLTLLCAIADNDTDRINEYRGTVKAWVSSKVTEGYVNCVKGIAAYYTDDKEECIYRLRSAKEIGEKTFLAAVADEYLKKLN